MAISNITITWITPLSFLETDIYIVPEISKHHIIDWHIICSHNESNNYQKELNEIKYSFINIRISLLVFKDAMYSIKTLFRINSYLNSILDKNNLLYVSLCCFPYFMPLLRLHCDVKKTIVVVHNVITPKGASSYFLTKIYTYYVLSRFQNFQTFSTSQYKALLNKKPNKNIFCSSFALKNYGIPTASLSESITFLSFGRIRDYKRIDVLICAAQKAFKAINIPFKVKIAGSCKDWEKYQRLIEYPFLFDLTIREIENKEIPNLFYSSHYFVMPYQDIAQSGSMIVSINYGKPIIASNLESFRDYVKSDETGFLFQPADVDELSSIICYVILNHTLIYPYLCRNIEQLKIDYFSTEKIANNYIAFFNTLLAEKK
ncbi:MAG: hypothetical protein CVU10_10045 [Bacteroidetes bacterium HGW-Bacteroidetes-5]|jgi:glycosyltransferase involved in cell wall biosynthesis|nr:MAG: hypothetical protein CVU10_10045 [Bacteroidetes bacterium HGW-Bacteroidetes-5]